LGTRFFRFVTNKEFDRQTDRQHAHGNTVHCMTCSRTVKMNRFPALVSAVAIFVLRSVIFVMDLYTCFHRAAWNAEAV